VVYAQWSSADYWNVVYAKWSSADYWDVVYAQWSTADYWDVVYAQWSTADYWHVVYAQWSTADYWLVVYAQWSTTDSSVEHLPTPDSVAHMAATLSRPERSGYSDCWYWTRCVYVTVVHIREVLQ